MKTQIYFLYTLLIFLFLNSCSDDNNPVKPPTQPTANLISKTVVLNTKSYKKWVYFSFSKGDTVSVKDYKNSVQWDIAFHRNNVRTNGGKSGKGKAAVADLGIKKFEEVIIAPSEKFVADSLIKIVKDISDGFPPPEVEVPGSVLMNSSIKFSGPPPSYDPNKHIYIIKTAEGKYVKYLALNFYDNLGNSGSLKFKYLYQPDGSKNLKGK